MKVDGLMVFFRVDRLKVFVNYIEYNTYIICIFLTIRVILLKEYLSPSLIVVRSRGYCNYL